jgi:hypothetical protein
MRATSCIARAQPANVFHGPFSRGHSERAESGYGGRRPLADEAASENMDYRKQLRLRLPDIRGRPRRLAVQDNGPKPATSRSTFWAAMHATPTLSGIMLG